MNNTFGIIDENQCPLYMVGNSAQDEIREYLNEWGAVTVLKKIGTKRMAMRKKHCSKVMIY